MNINLKWNLKKNGDVLSIVVTDYYNRRINKFNLNTSQFELEQARNYVTNKQIESADQLPFVGFEKEDLDLAFDLLSGTNPTEFINLKEIEDAKKEVEDLKMVNEAVNLLKKDELSKNKKAHLSFLAYEISKNKTLVEKLNEKITKEEIKAVTPRHKFFKLIEK